jgi:hypothetical protein
MKLKTVASQYTARRMRGSFSDGTPVNHSTEFIPGRVTDHTLFADSTNLEAGNEPYIRKLELQKPALAKALKEGCWAQFQGQYFTCWDEGPARRFRKTVTGPMCA